MGMAMAGAAKDIHQEQPVRVPAREAKERGHVFHERGLVRDEVVGGEDGDDGLGVPAPDPVNREENAGRRAPVTGLRQHLGAR